jgi:tetratricopeptide (TPR) repeat protein
MKTEVDMAELRDVLSSTIMLAYKQHIPAREKPVADYLRNSGVYTGTEEQVPNAVLQALWLQPEWADIPPGGTTREWLDATFEGTARRAVVPYAALGYMYFKLGDANNAIQQYARAVALDPSNYYNQKNVGSLLVDAGQRDAGLAHLTAARDIVRSSPDLARDSQKQQDLQQIENDIKKVQP